MNATPTDVRGFTLMETLVMLLLTALTTGLLYQMLGNYRIVSARVGANVQTVRELSVSESWLRGSIEGLVADAALPFKGSAQSLSGLSLNPVIGRAGRPVSLSWSVATSRDGAQLVYTQPGTPGFRFPMSVATGLHFAYLDREGKEHAQWPPAKGLSNQLPHAILIYQGRHRPGLLWSFGIRSRKNPQPIVPLEMELGE